MSVPSHHRTLGGPSIANPLVFQAMQVLLPFHLSPVPSWHPRSQTGAGSEFSVSSSESCKISTALDTEKPPETS